MAVIEAVDYAGILEQTDRKDTEVEPREEIGTGIQVMGLAASVVNRMASITFGHSTRILAQSSRCTDDRRKHLNVPSSYEIDAETVIAWTC